VSFAHLALHFRGVLSYLTLLFEQGLNDQFIFERDWTEDQPEPD
jgi:hypothetical protein